MAPFAIVVLGVATGGVVDAFRLPSGSQAMLTGDASLTNRHTTLLPATLVRRAHFHHLSRTMLSLSKVDGDAELAEEIEAMDTDLAREIEEALSLAQNALVSAGAGQDEDEENIDEIAEMLMEKPPATPPPLPVPPAEDPPDTLISLALEEADVDEEDGEDSPPIDDPPDIGEMLRKKAVEEFEKMKNLIFGLKEELVKAEAGTNEAEEAAALLKKEIEENLREREEMVKRIESEAASEKDLLVAQMEIASRELKAVVDQSSQNITEAKSKASRGEKELISRLDSFKAAIDEVTAEATEIRKDKERIEKTKQSMLDTLIQEGKDRLAKFQKSLQFDIDYAKQVNADLVRRVEEAEGRVRGAYDQINQMRSERVSLQQQIVDVEKNALEEIASLERELAQDDERYAAALQKERDRLDSVIDIAYQAYAVRICKKILEREAIEDVYREKIRKINMQITAAREKQDARVKEYLDKLEEKHKKERIAIYQGKVEALSAIRKQMNAELAVEYAKIEETHKTMKAKIDAIKKQTSEVKAEFEEEMAKKRQLAKEEEEEILREIEDVRLDMTDKLKTQRRLHEEKKAAYLREMNGKISDSEVELRQKWMELAGVKKSYSDVSAKRDSMIDDVAKQQALIDSYESERQSFRKSLRLTARVAREKISSKTRRLLGRDRKKSP